MTAGKNALTFGIPVYIHDSIAYGTEVQLVEVVNTYESGAMDVICVARQVFRVLTFDNEMEGRQYAGGVVQFLDNINDGVKTDKEEVLSRIEELYTIMDVPFSPIPVNKFNSFVLAHKMGLSYEQEYQLLQMEKESERLSFLKSHLLGTIQVLNEVNKTKELIDMNGHFKNFDPLDFKDFKLKQ